MTSQLVTARLQATGLGEVLSSRARGQRPIAELASLVERADTLLLGAAADLARRHEMGDEALIFVPSAPPADERTAVLRPARGAGGTAFLREVASLRLTGPIGVRIVIDWTTLGVETAQLALAFGASGLSGPLAKRGGLPLLEADAQRGLKKRRELSAYVERAGYRPRFLDTSEAPSPPAEVLRHESSTPDRGNAHVGS